ncbi:nucleoside triphosphate pyrophosphatase [Paraferrimonas sp. SM1919]|uniref:Maf family protein n=1 Tax=Paraferrimonas sp. SM1919 TaxID=2662263 RepID=UPI0013D4841C|nr:Maf family protein [Paraferrimonas sp. SM1919]
MLILASASPRRKQLLQQLGYDFLQIATDIDETPIAGEKPVDYVLRLAKLKAITALNEHPEEAISLGSDTIVVLDGQLLGKPVNKQHACQMLQSMQGRKHQVVTAVAVTNGNKTLTQAVTTEVEFCPMTLSEIEQYWLTGEPADKAGAYGIQGIGGNFVKAIVGSYSSVVGLPLVETKQLLQQIME